jgi:hypothetical protein
MRVHFPHIAVSLIVGLSLRAALNGIHQAIPVALGAMLVLVIWYLPSILSFLKRLYSPAPRGAVQPRPMPLCYVFDPETNTMTGVPRAALMQLLDGRKDSPHV